MYKCTDTINQKVWKETIAVLFRIPQNFFNIKLALDTDAKLSISTGIVDDVHGKCSGI